jgi:hypothetical protein
MKEITLKIPNTKLRFFMELIDQLGLEVTNDDDLTISKEHQDIVLDRIQNTKEEDLLNWDDIKDDFDGI